MFPYFKRLNAVPLAEHYQIYKENLILNDYEIEFIDVIFTKEDIVTTTGGKFKITNINTDMNKIIEVKLSEKKDFIMEKNSFSLEITHIIGKYNKYKMIEAGSIKASIKIQIN